MNIIVPMAGLGKRMRPHTLTTAKPLLPIAGKPIVERLLEDIVKVCGQKVEHIAFITAPSFGAGVETRLLDIARHLEIEGSIHYQDEGLGTAHAILCAKTWLKGPVVVAFADTLFKADFVLDTQQEGIIWVQRVEDPRAFGVVELNDEGWISAFHEKPPVFISNLAIIGIYFFKDGDYLHSELQYLIDHNMMDKGEYQLTSALENMKSKGMRFYPGTVTEWLDCGNKDATVHTNGRYLDFLNERQSETLVDPSAILDNCKLISPCYIGQGCQITNAIIGPHVSLGLGTKITNASIADSIVGEQSTIQEITLHNSMVGRHVKIQGNGLTTPVKLSLSDYSEIWCT
jgi:glucose-1-phosphate thymidylyltransferase